MKDIGKQTQTKIIQAIEDLVKEKSLDKVSIREICQKAQIAIGTFYIYFSSKPFYMFIINWTNSFIV